MSDCLNIVTWNTNFSGRTNGEFEAFSFSSRVKFVVEDIKSFLSKSTNTIFCFQEVMPEDLQYFLDLFEPLGFVTYKKTIHEVGRMLLTCFPPSLKTDLIKFDAWSVSKDLFLTNEEKSLNLRDSIDTFFIKPLKLFVVNAHFPMDSKFRLPITKIVANSMKLMSIMNDSASVIIAGDFNTFSNDGGLRQVQMFEEAGFSDLTKVILRSHTTNEKFVRSEPPQRVLETFAAYPYDVVRCEATYRLKTC